MVGSEFGGLEVGGAFGCIEMREGFGLWHFSLWMGQVYFVDNFRLS